ncbi:MAG: Asp-tRNA(Asn)/Glu-tRNA(Gln) amidotransferase subunit GatC [Clostridia bacterium]|jgi:aspartyl-tRNA(Asn)/glutamyl-tRNA(Gln) amidotransferase subunit C|nr:Asp-tRNA(Asn)/Glu-tRNA(Gln) amidotransferase subunit GatC [Clostridia bacterium]
MLDFSQVDELARAAKLELAEEDKVAFVKRLEELLNYMKKFLAMDLDNVEPFTFVNSITNVLREDEVMPGNDQDTALANAPLTQDGYFVVPKIELL